MGGTSPGLLIRDAVARVTSAQQVFPSSPPAPRNPVICFDQVDVRLPKHCWQDVWAQIWRQMASYSLHIFLSYLRRAVDFPRDTGENISVTVAESCWGVDGYDSGLLASCYIYAVLCHNCMCIFMIEEDWYVDTNVEWTTALAFTHLFCTFVLKYVILKKQKMAFS